MKKLLSLCLILVLLLTGCNQRTAVTYDGTFQEYLDSLYALVYDSSDISINLSFNNPEQFGITPEPYALGFSTQEDYNETSREVEEMLVILRSFKDKDLTEQEIIDRDALIAYLEPLANVNQYYMYEEGSALSSSRSFIMSIPSYLDVYSINSERDLTYYFNYLESLKDGFMDYLALEEERQAMGMGLSQVEIDEIISAARSIEAASQNDEYYLNNSFARILEDSDFLSQADKDAALLEHKRMMKEVFSLAYASLADGLELIQGGALTGLANKTNGKEYYEYLFKKNTGSSYSIAKVSNYLTQRKSELISNILGYFQTSTDPNLEANIQTGYYFQDLYADEQSLYDSILHAMSLDFPSIEMPNYEVRTVDASQRESSSPAFYFTPKVDATSLDTQYIYNNGDFDIANFTTYLHEGIPGHMYQFNYFMTLDQHPIRNLLSLSANAEGWANYVENYAVKYDLGDALGSFYADYMEFMNIIYIEIDLGINYWGWSQADTKNYLISLGMFTEDTPDTSVQDLYLYFVENPCIYPMYYLSSMYFRLLKEDAMEKWDDYSEYQFHERLLALGSTSFDVIESKLGLTIMK